MKDIVAASNLKRKNIARVYRQLIIELDYRVPNPDPVKCVAKLANNTNLSAKNKTSSI
jgi:transcription initiation factor TFIIB